MLFEDAFRDLSIKSVTLPRWKAYGDVIEMPVIVDGLRTPWCTLRSGGQEHKFLALELMRSDEAYDVVERYAPPPREG